MLTPVLEIVLFLSATFALGLALGWVLWSIGAKQEMNAIATERDFWKDSYNQARLKDDSNQEFAEEADPATTKAARKAHQKPLHRGLFQGRFNRHFKLQVYGRATVSPVFHWARCFRV